MDCVMIYDLPYIHYSLHFIPGPADWNDRLVVPIAEKMVKHMLGMTYDYWEPHGVDNILTVCFFPKSTSTKNT